MHKLWTLMCSSFKHINHECPHRPILRFLSLLHNLHQSNYISLLQEFSMKERNVWAYNVLKGYFEYGQDRSRLSKELAMASRMIEQLSKEERDFLEDQRKYLIAISREEMQGKVSVADQSENNQLQNNETSGDKLTNNCDKIYNDSNCANEAEQVNIESALNIKSLNNNHTEGIPMTNYWPKGPTVLFHDSTPIARREG